MNLDEFVSDYLACCERRPTRRDVAEAYVDQVAPESASQEECEVMVQKVLPQIAYYAPELKS